MNTKHLLPLIAFAGAFASLSAAPALLHWNFNEGAGEFSGNIGSAGNANLTLVAPGGAPAPAFSADAKGVSGKRGDYALDLTSADGMGAASGENTGPAGIVSSKSEGLSALSGLSSFTLSGWIQPAANINGSARIVASSTITLMAGTLARLNLQVNGVNSVIQSDMKYHQVGKWMFFAVTYDSKSATNNVTYYVGSTVAGSLVPAGVTTIAAGQLNPITGQFIVGNSSSQTRPFMGLIDNIAIHGSKTDATGALTPVEIEAIRAATTR